MEFTVRGQIDMSDRPSRAAESNLPSNTLALRSACSLANYTGVDERFWWPRRQVGPDPIAGAAWVRGSTSIRQGGWCAVGWWRVPSRNFIAALPQLLAESRLHVLVVPPRLGLEGTRVLARRPAQRAFRLVQDSGRDRRGRRSHVRRRLLRIGELSRRNGGRGILESFRFSQLPAGDRAALTR